MEYLRKGSVTVDGHTFSITELSFSEFQEVTSDEATGQLKAIRFGCPDFKGQTDEEISKLPMRIVAGISQAVVGLCLPEDAEGN